MHPEMMQLIAAFAPIVDAVGARIMAKGPSGVTEDNPTGMWQVMMFCGEREAYILWSPDNPMGVLPLGPGTEPEWYPDHEEGRARIQGLLRPT